MKKKIGRSRGRVLGCGLPHSYIGAVGFINFLSDAKILATTGLHVTTQYEVFKFTCLETFLSLFRLW